MVSLRPLPLADYPAPAGEGEIDLLRTLAERELPVADLRVVPPQAEEEFYRLNNLGKRIEEIFEGVDPGDPDDEEVEDLAPEARRLLESHYLLDEFIDDFYQAVAPLAARLRVRRPGGQGVSSLRGRPSLLALKRVWSAEWSFESVWRRLAETGSLLPPARPVLLHADSLSPGLPALEREAAAALGWPVELLGEEATGITGARRAAPR